MIANLHLAGAWTRRVDTVVPHLGSDDASALISSASAVNAEGVREGGLDTVTSEDVAASLDAWSPAASAAYSRSLDAIPLHASRGALAAGLQKLGSF
jgi:hypothetical protein